MQNAKYGRGSATFLWLESCRERQVQSLQMFRIKFFALCNCNKVALCILHSASHFSIPLRPHPSCRSLARGSLGAEIVFHTPCPTYCQAHWPKYVCALELFYSSFLIHYRDTPVDAVFLEIVRNWDEICQPTGV